MLLPRSGELFFSFQVSPEGAASADVTWTHRLSALKWGRLIHELRQSWEYVKKRFSKAFNRGRLTRTNGVDKVHHLQIKSKSSLSMLMLQQLNKEVLGRGEAGHTSLNFRLRLLFSIAGGGEVADAFHKKG